MRLIDFFDKAAASHPERMAFLGQDANFTYQGLHESSERLAAALQRAGLDAAGGERVAIYSPNCSQAFACVLGVLRAGAAWVPINARNAVDANIEFIDLTGCRWLIYHSSFADVVHSMRERLPRLTSLVCIDRDDGAVPSLENITRGAVRGSAAGVRFDTRQIATIIGSGGTTGRSKGVVLDNLVWSTLIAESCISLRSQDHPVHLCVAPMTHAAGVLTFMLMPQAPTNIVMDKLDPLLIMQCIEQRRVTHLYLPPSALYALLAHPRVREFDYSSLTHFLIAASPVAPEKLAEAVEVFGPCLCQCYGQVEAPMLITWLSQGEVAEAVREPSLRHRLKSCGRAGALSRVALMDAQGNLLADGQRGEIVLQGNLVTPCYWNNPQATAEARAFGWHHTGDIAWRDEDGYYYIVDRIKDMIISGGFNVYSAEVENVINGHPAVENCAVIGVPHEKWGEVVTAVIVLRPGMQVGDTEIIAFAKQKLGSVKAPKIVHFRTELPKSPVGKILKNAIRREFWAGAERGVN